MTTAADDSADEIAFEAFLAGRPVPAEADGSSPAVESFAGAVRATATLPGRPNAALAELLATGLLTDQSSPSIRTAPSAGRSPRRSRIRRRRRFAMFFPALLAKFLAAGAVAQAATGAGVAVVVVTAAGATGVLGDGVQHSIAGVVSPSSDEVAPQDDTSQNAQTGQAPAVTDPSAVDGTQGETTLSVEKQFDPAAWAKGPAAYKNFGAWVSDGAHHKADLEAAATLQGTSGSGFTQLVSEWATKKHMSAADLAEQGVDVTGLTGVDTEPAPVAGADTEDTDDAGTRAATTEHGNGGKASADSGSGGKSSGNGRGHN